jgi:hypothetical protein
MARDIRVVFPAPLHPAIPITFIIFTVISDAHWPLVLMGKPYIGSCTLSC